jgi:vitamin-K-epoxide reductase (warfarin-sensitive)
MNVAIAVLSGIGIVLSAYALYVKHQLGKNKNYKAVCDINEKVSCTKPMGSEYGSLFLIPNSAFGIVFYGVMVLLGYFDELQAVFWLAVLAVVGSVYLAYVSFFKLKVVCPVCTAIYVVNILLLVFSAVALY